MLDPDACHAALVARDARFDGLFFVGVATTGIYCRPICPARTPGRDRCSFHPCAAAAERAGFRACLRCRPELAPGAHDGAAVDAIARLVERAAALIDEGYLNERGVDDLAARLGVSARHLRRATEARLGVSPVELAQTRRLALAKQLLHDTRLGLAELAHASGFASVRRFNAAFRASFARAPSELRREHAPAASPALRLRLDHREPHDWPRLLAFLRARAIPGVELVRERSYHRVVHIGGHTGLLHVSRDPKPGALQALVSPALAPVLMPLVARLRRAFDLDARPDAIARDLGRDPLLAPHLRARPGLRVPGSFDDFEIAARAVLGQQVSVRAATTLAGRLVARFGVALPDLAPGLTGLTELTPGLTGLTAGLTDLTPGLTELTPGLTGLTPGLTELTPGLTELTPGLTELTPGLTGLTGLTHRFPTADELARRSPAELAAIGLPAARAATLHALALAFSRGPLREPPGDPEGFAAVLRTIPGVGEWSAQYLVLRGLHHPDAFPAGDLVLRKALDGLSPRAIAARAAAWRPWRAYAALHLWTAHSEAS
jgi:AraC family transcriptional regulator of adaptative response / DNA-3-methyladenine glycosylase II